ncbi:MAG: uroporphyrinogen decarboxylase [Gammaproteobacteria bacterium]|nr:uroporphyrinogen decarboxylase [Gammaproteobacteria bacterium]
MTLKNKIFLEALNRNNNEANIPVWLLRQAGRYLPEYMKIRSEYSDFFQMIKKPNVCKELTLQPLRRYPLDAAITFTDILTIPDAMGVPVQFIAGKGPVFADSIQKNHLLKLNPDGALKKLEYVFEATALIKANVEVPLIGFTGSPWTLFVYLFYGKSPKNRDELNSYLELHSQNAHSYLEQLTEITKYYVQAQIAAGADCIQIFDSWGGLLDEKYEELSLNYINQIASSIATNIPVILYTRDKLIDDIVNSTSITCFNLDTSDNIDNHIDKDITIQGNFDPKNFHADNEVLREMAQTVWTKYKDKQNYVFNLGSGLTPDVNPEKVEYFLNQLSSFRS